MKRKVYALGLAALLMGMTGMMPAAAAAETERTTIVHYRVKITSVHWYERALLPPLLFILGRNWKTMSIATTFVRDDSGNERVAEVNAWPNDIKTTKPDPDAIAFRLADGKQVEGFLWFLKVTHFRKIQVPQLLSLYTYLYNDNESVRTFDTTNLFEKKDGSMHCIFSKQRTADGNKVMIETLNGSKQVNGNVEIDMGPLPEPQMMRVRAELKIGILVILTRMDR